MNCLRRFCLSMLVLTLPVTVSPADELPLLRLDPWGSSGNVNGAVLSADGRHLVTVGNDKVIRLYSVTDGRLERSIRSFVGEGFNGILTAPSLDKTGRWLACGGWLTDTLGNPVVRIYDFASGEVHTLLRGHRNSVLSLAFSPDGSLLASGDGSGQVHLWKTADWSPGPTLRSSHGGPVYGLAFSPDGSRLCSTDNHDGAVLVHRVADGVTLARSNPTQEAAIGRVSWSPDGLEIATGGIDGRVRIWSPLLDEVKTVKAVGSGNLSEVLFLGGGKLLFGGTHTELHEGAWKNPVFVVDLDGGSERVYWGNENTLQALSATADGRLVISAGGNNGETLVWDAETLETRFTLRGQGRSIWSVAWTDDGPAFGTTNRSGLAPLDSRFSWVAHRVVTYGLSDGDTPRILLESRGERLSVSGNVDDPVLRVGKRSLRVPNYFVHFFTFTPDGESILVSDNIGLYRYDRRTLTLTDTFVGHEGTVWAVSVSRDGKTLVSGGDDQTLRFWDLENLAPVRFHDPSWFDQSWKDWVAEYEPDLDLSQTEDIADLYARLVAAGDTDAPKMVVGQEPVVHKPLLSLFVAATPGREWLAWTPEGYYDASLDGAKFAGWHFNRGEEQNSEFYSLDQYASVFYRPDVIEKALARVDFDPPDAVQFANRPPLLTRLAINGQVTVDDGETNYTTGSREFTLELTSTGTSALQQPELFYNGRVINQGKFKGPPEVSFAPDKQSLRAHYTFSLTNPDNRYKIYTVDAKGFKSAAKTIHVLYTGPDANPSFYHLGQKVAAPRPAGTLYVLAIGINQYTNPAMAAAGMGNLAYAEKDAADMAALWAGQQGKLFGKVETWVITKEKLGHSVTLGDIRNALTTLGKQTFRDTDSVLVFLSGHGLRRENGFYFLSSEADPTSKASLDQTSPSWLALGDKLKSFTRAKEIIVLVDACHSGAINPTELGFTWKDKGVVLITSSQAGQKSYEGGSRADETKWGTPFVNGLFTKAILEAFTRSLRPEMGPNDYAAADSSQDNVLIVGEVLNYAIQQVGEWTNGQQTPWVPAYDPAIEGKVLGVVR